MAGYWGQTPQGYQWNSGYWADAAATETTYLPAPPPALEEGPNVAAPSVDYCWTPGCWIWSRGRYAWRPGYWAQGQADWDWFPAHYVWTPRGYIFVDGFWDYPVERRGMLFAPVYFESNLSLRRGYSYSPRIVLNLSVFSDHLFLRPRYQHYYFGDYYAASYAQGGFYASFSLQSRRSGYDPFYSRQRWEHRQDRDWEHRVEASYQNRRDNEAARPPRTWAAERSTHSGPLESGPNRVSLAMSVDQLVARKDGPMRFQPVAREERQQLAQRGQDVQKSRDQRRAFEAKDEKTTVRKPGGVFEPAKVQLPRSPIVGRPANQLRGNQTPPKVPQAPKPDLKVQPKAEPPGREPNLERNNPPSQPRRLEPEQKPSPGRPEAAPRERPVQPEAQQRANDAATKAQADSQRNARATDQKAQQESAQRAKDAAVKATEDSQRNAQGLEKRKQQDEQQRAKDAAAKAQENSQRNARGQEQKAQQESAQRAKDAAAKAAEDSKRNAKASTEKTQRTSDQPARKGPDAGKKVQPQEERKEHKEDDKGKPSPPEDQPKP